MKGRRAPMNSIRPANAVSFIAKPKAVREKIATAPSSPLIKVKKLRGSKARLSSH